MYWQTEDMQMITAHAPSFISYLKYIRICKSNITKILHIVLTQ